MLVSFCLVTSKFWYKCRSGNIFLEVTVFYCIIFAVVSEMNNVLENVPYFFKKAILMVGSSNLYR